MLLFFMRVKCGFGFSHLAYLFSVASKTARAAFKKILDLLDVMFRMKEFDGMQAEELSNAPAMDCLEQRGFKHVLLIIDGTEFFIRTPKKSLYSKLTWSSYKHHHTVKVLVGINRSGNTVFVSDAHPGRISDKQQVIGTGILSKLPPGCAVMADKGFLIADVAKRHGIEVVIPPLASSKVQLSESDLNKGRKIAKVRIHVERAIERAKSFQILAQELNNSCFKYVSKLIRVCFMVANMRGELVFDDDVDTEQ
jgi:hypothetical protein